MRTVRLIEIDFDSGTRRFIEPIVGVPRQVDAIPALQDVTIAPQAIEPGKALGKRDKITATVLDFKTGDNGTFWGKLRASDPYYLGRPIRVYTGSLPWDDTKQIDEQPAWTEQEFFAGLTTHHYIVEKIDGPSVDGRVTITAKDRLKLADDDRAQVPLASEGELAADITESDLSATLSPSGIGDADYPASDFHVAIGREIMHVSSRSGDVLTIDIRGDLGTTAESHTDGDTVQIVKTYSGLRVDDIMEDMFINFVDGVDASHIPSDRWDQEASQHLPRLYTAHIPKPTSVRKLLDELAEQVGFQLWWNDLANTIELVAIKPPGQGSVIDDQTMILEDSLRVTDQPERRLSRVWTSFGIINPTEKLEDQNNYRSTLVSIDAAAESVGEYGRKAVKKVFSRWIDRFNKPAAQALNDRLLQRFRDIPRRIEFALPLSMADLVQIGETHRLKTRLIQDTNGNPVETKVLILSKSVDKEKVSIVCDEQKYTPPPTGARQIIFDSDTFEANLRTIHDSIYQSPTGAEDIEVIVEDGVTVGSDTAGVPSMDVGDWPNGQPITIVVYGRIQGRGGDGGAGGDKDADNRTDGEDGFQGGAGLYTRLPVTVDNQSEIWGGGGGGGGGGAARTIIQENSGGGGGGGQGFEGGKGGVGPDNGKDGTNGGKDTIGTGGGGPGDAGTGGAGGAAGESGEAGEDSPAGGESGKGGAGGPAGPAVDGESFVTYTTVGDIRGPRIN